MLPIVGVSLEEALLGFGSDDGSNLGEKTINSNGIYLPSDDNLDGYSKVTVNVSGGLTLDYILNNGHQLFQGAQPVAAGTELENDLADYSINIYFIDVEKVAGSVTQVTGSIGSSSREWRDDFVTSMYYPYRFFCVYYVNGSPVCAHEIYSGNLRAVKEQTYYTWGMPFTPGETEHHYTDWDYAILPSYEEELIMESGIGAGRYVPRPNTRYASSGYIQMYVKDYSYPSYDYPQFLFKTKRYSYDIPPAVAEPTLSNVTISTKTTSSTIGFYYPAIISFDTSFDFVRRDGMSVDEMQQLFLDISGIIYRHYMT